MDMNRERRERAALRIPPRVRGYVEKGLMWLLSAAVGALLAFASPGFEVRPFGIAIAAASGTLFPAFALGVATFAIATRDFVSVAALGILAICRLLASLLPGARGERPPVFGERVAYRVLSSAVTMLAVGLYVLIRGELRLYYLIALCLGVVLAPLAASLLVGLFQRKSECYPYAREIGVSALLLLCIFSTREAAFLGIYPAAVGAALVAFFLSAHRGTLFGAAGGLLAGLAFHVMLAPAFLLCGVGCGLLEKSSRGGAVLTGGALGALYAFAVSGADGLSQLLPALLTAGALFLASDSAGLVEGSPVQLLATWRRRAAKQAAGSMELAFQRERIGALSRALTDVSGVLYELGGRGRRPSLSELKHLCDRELDRVCPDCAQRDVCWGSEYNATAEAVSKLALRLQTSGIVGREHAGAALAARCRALPEILRGINEGAQYLCEEALRGDKTSVVAKDFAAVARVLEETLALAAEGHTPDVALGDRIAARLRRTGYTLDTVVVYGKQRRAILLRGLRLPWRHVKHRELREQLQEICRFPLGEVSVREAEGVPDLLFCERVSLSAVTVKHTRAKARDGSYCGDSVLSFSTDEGRAFAFLCDGMGSGNGAALTSALATTVLSSLLRAGNPSDTSLRMLGGILAARGRRQSETSTTVDLLEVDLVRGRAALFKCGAAPTYLLRRGTTTRFFSRTAPVGILEVLDAERLAFDVEVGDVIVQVSDGVTGGEEECPWLADMLVTRFDGDADRFARRVLARAGEEGRDDLSILVTEIKSA